MEQRIRDAQRMGVRMKDLMLVTKKRTEDRSNEN